MGTRTRFSVGERVWYLNVVTDTVDIQRVEEIRILEGGVMYLLENGFAVSECGAFSSKESLREHYLAFLG